MDLLLEHGPVQSPHVAIYLESVAHLEPPQFLQRRLVNEDADFASVLKQPYVTEHEMDWWPFLRRGGMHLLEIWARLPGMPERHYAARLKYLAEIGIDLHKYRHKDCQNIVMLVVDACKDCPDFANLLAKLRVLIAAHADFLQDLDEKGRTAIWKVRDMVSYIKRCEQTRLGETQTDFDWNDTVMDEGNEPFVREVKQFELMLDQMETDHDSFLSTYTKEKHHTKQEVRTRT